MYKKLSLPLILLAATTLVGAHVLADDDDASYPADQQEAPHSHPMIPASSAISDDNDTDNAEDNAQQDNSMLISGGVGDDDLAHMKSIENQYNIKLLIAEQNGTFLSNVKVHIEDKKGQTVADTTTEGPILLAKLPAGTYKITATRRNGEVKTFKATVAGKKLRAYSVTFKNTDERDSGDPKTTPLQ